MGGDGEDLLTVDGQDDEPALAIVARNDANEQESVELIRGS